MEKREECSPDEDDDVVPRQDKVVHLTMTGQAGWPTGWQRIATRTSRPKCRAPQSFATLASPRLVMYTPALNIIALAANLPPIYDLLSPRVVASNI